MPAQFKGWVLSDAEQEKFRTWLSRVMVGHTWYLGRVDHLIEVLDTDALDALPEVVTVSPPWNCEPAASLSRAKVMVDSNELP